MVHLIDKAALVAEIDKRIKVLQKHPMENHKTICHLDSVKQSVNSFEVKDVDTWHLQSKEDIYDVVKDWGLYTFACIMKDGTIQKFTGNLNEDCDGHIDVHIDGVNDDYDNVDDIVYWIEIPIIKS